MYNCNKMQRMGKNYGKITQQVDAKLQAAKVKFNHAALLMMHGLQ